MWDRQRGRYVLIKADFPDFQPMPYNQYTTQESAATKQPPYLQYQLPAPFPTPDTSIFCPNSSQVPHTGVFHHPVDSSQAHLGQSPLQTGYVSPHANGAACTPTNEATPGPPPIPSSHMSGLEPILEPTLPHFSSHISSPGSAPNMDSCVKVGATSETPKLRLGARPRFPRATRHNSTYYEVRKGKPYTRPTTITFVSAPPASRSNSSRVGDASSVQGRSPTSGSTSSGGSPSSSSHNQGEVQKLVIDEDQYAPWFLAIASDMIVAPPSPEITVTSISTPKDPRFKDEARDKVKAHICNGFGPTVEEKLIVTGPPGAQNAPFMGKIEPRIGSPDNWWRCRWDGCRMMARATQQHIKAHMRIIHGIGTPASASSLPAGVRKSQTDDGHVRIRCLWHPPLRVKTPEHPDPVFVTSHSHSYVCDIEIELSSVVNHIGTHLRFERQPNAMAVMCCHKVVMSRGSHGCPNTKEETRKKEEANEEWVKAFVSAKCRGLMANSKYFFSSDSLEKM